MISRSFRVALPAFLFVGALGLASTGPVQAQSIMKQCGDEWKAAKENNTTNGMKWPDFLKQCRVQKEGAAAPAAAPVAAPAPAPAPVARAPEPPPAAPAPVKAAPPVAPPSPAPSASNSQDDIDALLNGLDEATTPEEIRPAAPELEPAVAAG